MLSKKQLINKIKDIEWEDFELKKAKNSVPKNAWETVSAFANTKGGYLIFGVKQVKAKFRINGVNNPEKVHNDFITTLRSEKFNIALSAQSKKIKINNQDILIYYIPEMPRQTKPIYFNNIKNTFLRYGHSDQKATQKEVEKLLREASKSSSDSMVFENADLDDLNKDTINRFKRLFQSETQDKELAILDSQELLLRKGFLKKHKDGKMLITAAAILQFGTDLAITKYFPYFKIDYFEVPGTNWGGVRERRWDYRIRSESNLFETFYMIMPRLKIRVPIPFKLKEDSITRDDSSPALIAIREALINLLVHADYFDRKGASIKVYEDRIELFNGGSLLFDEKLLVHGDISEPRNPIIIRAFRMINLAEDAGSGFFKIFNNWKKAGFKKPEFYSNRRENFFKFIFWFKSVSEKIESNQQVTPQVPRKHPASNQQAKKILNYCKKPKSRDSIKNALGLKDREYFRSKILKPFVEKRFLKMTIPDKPTSPKQKYVITDKGKKLLENL